MADGSTTHCAHCGVAMVCEPEGECWCMALPPRLPVPDGPAACLCPRCLEETPVAQHPSAG